MNTNTPAETTLADVVAAADALEKFTITVEPADPAELVREALDGLSAMVAYVEKLAVISAALESDGFSEGEAAIVEFDYTDAEGEFERHYRMSQGRLRLLGKPADPEHTWGLTGYVDGTSRDARYVLRDFHIDGITNIVADV